MLKLPAWIWIVIVLVPILILSLYKGKLLEGLGLKQLLIKKTETVKIDKTDKNWLENYCLGEVKNLPEAPFSYTKKEIQPRSWSRPSDLYLKKYIPEDKWSKAQTCAIWYRFENKPAYASIGIEYVLDIKAFNAFEQNTDTLYTKAIDKSWKKISPIDDKEGGRPPYSYDGIPLVFTRENKDVGTTEYATVHFGSHYLYVHFTIYENTTPKVQGVTTGNSWWQALWESLWGTGWKTFHSEQYGYSLKYPKNWQVQENSTATSREVILTASDKSALVRINAYNDLQMTTVDKITQATAAMKTKMKADKNLRVTAFKDSLEGQLGGYIAQGYQKFDTEEWRFENRGLLATNGRVLIMHGAVKPLSPAAQWKIIYEIMKGFTLDKNK